MDNRYLERAKVLHRMHPVVDAHLDLAAEVYIRRLQGERNVVERRYLPHFREAGLNLVVSSVYVSNAELEGNALHRAVGQIAALREDIETIADQVEIVTDKKELNAAIADGKVAVLLAMEGLDPMYDDLYLIRSFYDLGVRGAGLTWSRPNAFAVGCCKASEMEEIPGGLTALGKEAVAKLEELGMYVDVSHLNNDGFADLLKIATKPLIASHSNAWSVQENYRNLRDDQMLAIAQRGGVIGLNANCRITGASALPEHREKALVKLCEHVEYLVDKVGAEHVGFGFDLCNGLDFARTPDVTPDQLGDLVDSHSDMPRLTAKLLERGMAEEIVVRIMGRNFLEFYRKMLK